MKLALRWTSTSLWLCLVTAAFACGEPPVATAPPEPDAAPAPLDSIEDPDRARALASPLHRVHLESLDPIQCSDCHRIVGPQAGTEVVHRCLGCHPSSWSAVHAFADDDEARNCTSCHEFVLDEGQEPSYWACTDCHLEGGETERAAAHPNAPKVHIHDDEWCANCHVPHGAEAVNPRNCSDCHNDLAATNHRRKPLAGADACEECHGGHEPASAALAGCADCHAEDVRPAALFKGHDQCTSCHAPHETQRRGVRSCAGCHDDVTALSAGDSDEHDDCSNCHDEHRVKAAQSSCERCHDGVRSTHSPDKKKGACLGCHPAHPGENKRTRRDAVTGVSCSECHDDATTPNAHHGAKTLCTDCHVPHEFDLEGKTKDPAFCLSCHGGGAPRAKRTGERVQPVKGHDQCVECHAKGAHEPAGAPPSCGSCHEPQKKTITRGHDTCTDCHPAHEGRVPADVTCESCHEDQTKARHSAIDGGCESCHRSHGPEGVAEPPRCETCHETKTLFGLHKHADHAGCGDCHQAHEGGPTGDRASCLTECHQELSNHEPEAKTCIGCHPFDNPGGAR